VDAALHPCCQGVEQPSLVAHPAVGADLAERLERDAVESSGSLAELIVAFGARDSDNCEYSVAQVWPARCVVIKYQGNVDVLTATTSSVGTSARREIAAIEPKSRWGRSPGSASLTTKRRAPTSTTQAR
jgi:hypothetical protein